MEMKLNIYEKKKIIKTYTAETYDLLFGTVEDLVDILELDTLKTGSDIEVIKLATNVITKGMDIIKPLLKDIFEGLTDDELRNTHVSEIVTVLVEVIKFAINQTTKGQKLKN